MPSYRLCHIEGPNDKLKMNQECVIKADSFAQALATRTFWPVTETYDHAIATAQNPGTCTYYQEMWEATLLPDSADCGK